MVRTLLGYILPRPKDPPVKTGPLLMETTEELLQTHALVMKKVGSGQISPGEAMEIESLIECRRRLIESQCLEKRVRDLEQLLGAEKDKAA